MELRMQLKIARIEKELTMGELSSLSGVAKSSISEIESGKKSPTAKTIERLAEELGYKLIITPKGE